MSNSKNPFTEQKVSGGYKNTEEIYFQSSTEILNFILENLKPSKNSTIVDLGAGTGILAVELDKLGFKNITLVDPSDSMLAQAKQRLGGKFKYLNLTAEKLQENFKNNLDIVIAMNALHLFPDLNLALNSITSSLKNNGYFVFNSTAPSFAFEHSPTDEEKKLLKANLEFYSGLAAISTNPIAVKTKELLEMFYQGNYAYVYNRARFQGILAAHKLQELHYKEVLLTISNENQKSIWMMIAQAFVDEPLLIEKLINSIKFDDSAKIRQACFIYQKV